jgi:HEAT repeat protein
MSPVISGDRQPDVVAVGSDARAAPDLERIQATLVAAARDQSEAVDQLLHWLAGDDRAIQSAVQHDVRAAATPAQWSRLIEFLAAGRWGTLPPTALADDVRESAQLRRTLRGMLAAPGRARPPDARFEALRASLPSPLMAIRLVAVDALGRSGDRAAVKALIPLLDHDALPVTEEVMVALGRLGGPDAVAALVQVLRDQREGLLRFAEHALVRIGADAVQPLLGLLQDPNDDVRWHAVSALGELRDARVISTLVDLLDDPEIGVRWAAARGLSHLGPPAVEAVLRALETRPLTPWLAQTSEHVLHHATGAGRSLAFGRLLAALDHQTASVEVPLRAAELLAELTG